MVRHQFHPVALFYFILVTHPIPNQRRPGLTSGYGKRNGAIFNSIYSHSTNDIYIQQIAFTFNKSHSHSTIHIQHITFTFNKLYLYSTNWHSHSTNYICIQQIAFTFNKLYLYSTNSIRIHQIIFVFNKLHSHSINFKILSTNPMIACGSGWSATWRNAKAKLRRRQRNGSSF